MSKQTANKKNNISKSARKRKPCPSNFTVNVFDWASAFVAALSLVVLVMTFCVRVVNIDGGSMMPTLQDKNKTLVTGLNYEPKVGDIVVISHGVSLNKMIVKRVIAVGGQTVDIDFKTGEVTVDGVVLDEPYINGKTLRQDDVAFPLEVAEGTVFVLGDNRPISHDSRASEVGLIETQNIVGKVRCRLFPFDKFGTIE